MSINLTEELAVVSSNIVLVQSEIAEQEERMNGLLGAEDFDESMAEVRVYIELLRASLGALRSSESYLKEQINEDKAARKEQNELAKA